MQGPRCDLLPWDCAGNPIRMCQPHLCMETRYQLILSPQHKQGASSELWPSLLLIFPRQDSEILELGQSNSISSPNLSKRAIPLPLPYIPRHGVPLTGAGGVQGCVPLTFPLASAVPGADALQQVPTVILLAPVVSNSVGSLGVVVIAAICVRNRTLSWACTGWLHWALPSSPPPTPPNKLIWIKGPPHSFEPTIAIPTCTKACSKLQMLRVS